MSRPTCGRRARLRRRIQIALAGPRDATGLRPALHHAIVQTDDMLDLSALFADPAESAQPKERVRNRFVPLESSRTSPVAAIGEAHGGTVHRDDNQPGVKAMVTVARRPK